MTVNTILFDLDGTLYSNDCGLWQAIGTRISAYMRERMGFSSEEEKEIRSNYLRTYGTTLNGLQIHYDVDPDDYLSYVHDVPMEQYLSPDPNLHDLLEKLPQSKWIFTNADYNHADRVMTTLGVQNLFSGVIDIRALDYICKPRIEAYQKAMKLANTRIPRRQFSQIAEFG